MMKDFNGKGSQHNSKQGIQSKEEIRAGNGSGILRERRGALWSHWLCFAQGSWVQTVLRSFLQLCGKQIDSYQLILIVFSSSLLCDVKFQTISCNSVD